MLLPIFILISWNIFETVATRLLKEYCVKYFLDALITLN